MNQNFHAGAHGVLVVSSLPDAVAAEHHPDADGVPDYLRRVYSWAYLSRFGTWFFDRQWIVNMILWGHAERLAQSAIAEIRPGSRVLQNAAVYGDLSPRLACHLGPGGYLEVADIAPVQLQLTRRKLSGHGNAVVRRADASVAPAAAFDVVLSFFLLHEVPDAVKRQVVDAVLHGVAPGGKAVFVDYHRPRAWHPLRLLMTSVFCLLEPFAKSMWHRSIRGSADSSLGAAFSWRTETHFGGLYQTTVATRVDAGADRSLLAADIDEGIDPSAVRGPQQGIQRTGVKQVP